jgi:hypothetical protein
MPLSSYAARDYFANHLRDVNRRIAENPPISLSDDRISPDVDDPMSKKKAMFHTS